MPEPKLHVVLGKGGVGKSTVAAALALAAARRGRRVLAIELDTPGGLSRALGVVLERAGAIVRGPQGVSVAYFEGARALAEYLERIVRLGPLLGPVLDHPAYRAFVQAAPGLKELMVMGKVRDELILQKNWDTVVLDAGASGHALEYLRMPSAARDTFGRGRVHANAKRIHALLCDPKLTRIHVVTLAQEMPVAEAIELRARLREELGLPLGLPIVNRCLPAAPASASELQRELLQAPAAVHTALAGTLRHTLGWLSVQKASIAALADRAQVEPVRLPRIPRSPLPEHDLIWLGGLVAAS